MRFASLFLTAAAALLFAPAASQACLEIAGLKPSTTFSEFLAAYDKLSTWSELREDDVYERRCENSSSTAREEFLTVFFACDTEVGEDCPAPFESSERAILTFYEHPYGTSILDLHVATFWHTDDGRDAVLKQLDQAYGDLQPVIPPTFSFADREWTCRDTGLDMTFSLAVELTPRAGGYLLGVYFGPTTDAHNERLETLHDAWEAEHCN